MRNELRKTLVAIAVAFVLVGTVIFLTGAVNDINAHYPGGITLSGNAHLYTDSGAQLLRDGAPVGGGGGTVGTMINTDSLTTGDLIASKDGTTTNMTKATSSNIQTALGSVYVPLSGGTMTGNLFSPIVSAGQFQQYQDTLVYAASIALDFSSTNAHKITLTGDLTLTTSNLATNRTCRLLIIGDSVNRGFTFPSWHFLNQKPTVSTATKYASLYLEAWGANDTDVIAFYAEEP